MSPSSATWPNATLLATIVCLLVYGAGLGYAASAAVKKQAAPCMGCHGPGGQSRDSSVSSLAGQTAGYIEVRLQDFKSGQSHSDIMSPIAKDLTQTDMHQLAQYFSTQPRMSGVDNVDIASYGRPGNRTGSDQLPAP